MTEQTNLNDFGVFNKDSEMEIPLILSTDHAEYLYKKSHEYEVQKDYERLIDEKLEEEKLENEHFSKEEEIMNAQFQKIKYIRIGA